jgi:hypothetical protein
MELALGAEQNRSVDGFPDWRFFDIRDFRWSTSFAGFAEPIQ